MTNSEPPHPPRSTHCGTLPLPTSNPAATRADYLRAGGAVLLFLLPCLPFLFSGVIWFPDRGVLVAEYLVVGIVAPIARRWLIALLVIAFVVADLLYTLGKTFFYSPLLYVKSIPFSQLLNIATVESALYIIASAAAVFVAFQIGYWGARLSNKYSSAFLSFLLVIFICLDALNDSGGFIKANGIRVVSANILSSSFLQIVLNVRRELASQSKDAELIMGATGIYRDNLSQLDGTRNLVLIIVESLGLPVQSRHTKFLFDSLERLSAQRRVLKGSIPFKGATTAAEMRELCFSSLDYRHLTRDTESPWPCLPQD